MKGKRVVGAHIVKTGDKGVGLCAVLLELILHFADQIEVVHAVAQVTERCLVGGLGDCTGFTHNRNLGFVFDHPQRHDQLGGQRKCGARSQSLQVEH
ncbi:MAG: hypothetical protein R2867_16620 [Caldilineaceae bacterium]